MVLLLTFCLLISEFSFDPMSSHLKQLFIYLFFFVNFKPEGRGLAPTVE